MNKKIVSVLTLFFLFISTVAWAQTDEYDGYQEPEEEIPATTTTTTEGPVSQEEERPAWRDRVFFGGGGGLQFSNFATFISVMPSVGYRITPKLSSGVIGIYQYTYFRDFRLSSHNYGASFFSRYFVLPQVYASAEYEQVNFDIISFDRSRSRRWVDRMLVGGGYFQQGGGRGGFHIGVLYDLLYTGRQNDPLYPYQSPFVYRVGFIF